MDSRVTEGRYGPARLLIRQVGYQNRMFFRSPIAAFFTLIFPLMIFLIFVAIFGNTVIEGTNGITTAQYFSPALAVFGAVSAAYTSLAINTSIARDQGILKRIRGTPLPPWIYMAGRIGSAVCVAGVAVLLMVGIGVLFFDLQIVWRHLPALVVTFVLGVACWAALGLALVGVAPSADAVQTLTNATLLPLAFFSSVFFSPDVNMPAWATTVGNLFPLKHFAAPFGDAFDPTLTGSAFDWGSLAILVAWGLFGVVVAVRFFKWEPRAGGGRRSRRHRVVEP